MVLETLTDFDTDLLCTEQPGHGEVVFQIWAGGISPRVPAAAVLLAEQTSQRGAILTAFGTDLVARAVLAG